MMYDCMMIEGRKEGKGRKDRRKEGYKERL